MIDGGKEQRNNVANKSLEKTLQNSSDRSLISEAVEELRKGELVAFPTETVYGLGADAQNIKALEKLFTLKGRPISHPVIVHLFSFEQLETWCKMIPEEAKVLAEAFWPGPLTLILPRSKKAMNLVTGGQDSVGIRIPGHPIARELLQSFGDGIAAPSANKFGRLSPTSAEHVRQDLGDSVKVILDGGNCQVGIESTIVDLSNSRPQILRPGIIGADRIAQVLNLNNGQELEPVENRIRASGGLPSHYAPHTPLKIMNYGEIIEQVNKADFGADGNGNIAVLSFHAEPRTIQDRLSIWITAKSDPVEYARNLYADLRKLDCSGASYICVETLPEKLSWFAIIDRLKRAACREF
jgi:L-threonylcarbamoyladenylate synthase